MENKQLYVITVDVGSYDDAYVNILFVTDDFDKGSAYVNKQNEVYQSCKAKVDSFHKKEYKLWLSDNPYPDYENSHTDPTKNNMQRKQAMHQIQQERMQWLDKSQKFTNEWLKDHLTAEEYEMHFCKLDCPAWSIDPVKWF